MSSSMFGAKRLMGLSKEFETREQLNTLGAIMGCDLTGYVTLGLAVVTAVLVVVTIYHAWQSKHLVDEMRKDRRRQFLENMLEKIFSPLYEMLRRGLVLCGGVWASVKLCVYTLVRPLDTVKEYEFEPRLKSPPGYHPSQTGIHPLFL